MSKKLSKIGYELRDVAVVQAPVSFCNHRGEVNPFINVCGREVYPVFVAPMASVTDQNNWRVWLENGLTPVVPRSVMRSEENPDGLIFEERMEIAKETFVSVSLKEAQVDLVEYLMKHNEEGPFYICIDIAHGTLGELYDACRKLKYIAGKNIVLMTGNVANPEAYKFYADAGVDFMRVSVGSGSRCMVAGTRILMADGTTRAIEDIVPGDIVKTKSGDRQVLNVFEKDTDETVVINGDIESTPDHKFFAIHKDLVREDMTEEDLISAGSWVSADDLDENYLLFNFK